jgi:nitroreductase
MNIYETIEKRRSVRAFRDDPVPDDLLEKVLNAGRMAPSAQNAQDYKFIVIKDPEKRKDIAKACSEQRFIAEAPIIVAGISTNTDYVMSSGVLAYPIDVAIAIDHMTLAAVEEGFGTCWIGSFSQEEIKGILGVPDEFKVVALFPLGVPYDEPGVKSRKHLKDLVCYDKFSK